MRCGSIVRLSFPVSRLGRAFGFGDGRQSGAFEVVHAGTSHFHGVWAGAGSSFLYYVFEQRRVVVDVMMVSLPRSTTTKVKAQEFAGHACFERLREGDFGHARDRAEASITERKKLGFRFRCGFPCSVVGRWLVGQVDTLSISGMLFGAGRSRVWVGR
jgi:hypothetical protein